MVNSPKQKVTLNLPSEVVRAYRLAAVRQGVADQALIETALREYLGLNALKDLQTAVAPVSAYGFGTRMRCLT